MMTVHIVLRMLWPVMGPGRRLLRFAAPAAALMSAGCATLPTNAPTVGQVERGAAASKPALAYTIVDVDAQTAATRTVSALGLVELEALSALGNQARTDLIRKGDTLTIRIFEVGVSLFANQARYGTTAETPAANGQTLVLQVREDGTIDLPYAGVIMAQGAYPEALAQTIKARLRPYSESPEALVSITDSLENTAYVSGVVSQPGRYRLTSARERLLDVLALAGGPKSEVEDAELRIVRGGKVAAAPLDELQPEDLANIVVMPEDRIEIRRRRRTFTVFGATDRVSQVPFEAQEVTLAEAVARVGGPSDSRANPRGVFVFRFERGEAGAPPKPVIYRLDLMKADSYFLSQLFKMQDKDVILFANADANLPGKFIGMLNQLLSPVITASVIADTNR